jgi:uncharacterized damage-inducible protein DinB
MITPDYCQTMARYNQWMNQRLYAVCSSIDDVERKRDRGAFFGSIHSTLNHLLYADIAWLNRFQQRESSLPAMGQDLYPDFDDLQRHREQFDRELLDWTRHLSADWLAQPFEFTSKVDGQTRIRPTWLLVTQVFNHQTHHRGQITTLLSQAGYDYGVTDLPWLPTEELAPS